MAQSITAILSCQPELAARANRRLHDINEASLLVGRIVSRAVLLGPDNTKSSEALAARLDRELDALLDARQAN